MGLSSVCWSSPISQQTRYDQSNIGTIPIVENFENPNRDLMKVEHKVKFNYSENVEIDGEATEFAVAEKFGEDNEEVHSMVVKDLVDEDVVTNATTTSVDPLYVKMLEKEEKEQKEFSLERIIN